MWSKLLQQELDDYVEFKNARKSWKNDKKAGPSGCSSNDAFSMPEAYGLQNCLQPLTDEQLNIVWEIGENLNHNGVKCEELMAFTSAEFSARAEAAYHTLDLQELTFENVWHVFQNLLPLLE